MALEEAFYSYLEHCVLVFSVKRYSGEGAEALLVACDTLYRLSARSTPLPCCSWPHVRVLLLLLLLLLVSARGQHST